MLEEKQAEVEGLTRELMDTRPPIDGASIETQVGGIHFVSLYPFHVHICSQGREFGIVFVHIFGPSNPQRISFLMNKFC
jgi:hypothetical protein